ncbi:MAG: cysteine--tRNA ligase, partial [Bacteroidia bacterium]|nr:cysteine--tRNA ligase [Bacteroidia bacterium]
EKGYSAMAVRFFMMQTHYRSTLDFSNEALQASEKGYARLMNAIKLLEQIKPSESSGIFLNDRIKACYNAMNDDFNSPILLAELFEIVREINSANDGKISFTQSDILGLKKLMHDFVFDVLGLKSESSNTSKDKALQGVMEIILEIRKDVKAKKDFATSDKLRDDLAKNNITIKDTKDGSTWSIQE